MKELLDEEKAVVEQINALISTAKTSWFALLSYLAFVGVTLMGVEDADFFIPSRQTDLPLIGVSVPTALFFYVAPGLGAAIYAYFHLHLLKLWEPLCKADARIGDTPLSDRIAPWLIADVALSKRDQLSGGARSIRQRPLNSLANSVSQFLAYFAAPLVLGAFWFRSMPKHDEWLTVIFIGLPLLATMYIGKRNYEQMIKLASGTELKSSQPNEVWVAMVALVSVFGVFATNGTNDNDPRMQTINAWLNWPIGADLSDVNFSQPPEDWEDYPTARNTFRKEWCKSNGLPALVCGQVNHAGTIASDQLTFVRQKWCDTETPQPDLCVATFAQSDVDFKSAWKIEYATYKARLSQMDFRGKDFRGADLSGARMEGANLRDARMEGANLRDARMEGANLILARMEGADLWDARMDGADLRGARMEGANLILARMEGADLWDARMEGANLILARMEGANLRDARMEGADLRDARMEGAILWGARLDSDTTLTEATLRGASVRVVDFTNVSWEQSQIDTMFGDRSVTLPEGLNYPAHWPDWELRRAFDGEWRKWQADPDEYTPPAKSEDG